MADVLPASKFDPTAGSRKAYRETLIEDAPQVSIRRAPPQKLQRTIISPMSDSFPTPKANTSYVPITDDSQHFTSSESESDKNSTWSKGSYREGFDELYDISESESEELPIKLSTSVKKRVGAAKSRYPSLVIPSPGQWPTIEKLKSSTALSPPTNICLSPAALAHFQLRSQRIPSTSSAPSLDGSLTSEELALSSCPSTPDIAQQGEHENVWEAPVQLDPSAFSLLQTINADDNHEQQLETVIEVPEEAVSEMREIVESPPLTGRFSLKSLNTKNLAPANGEDADDELSALSVPSPGGFFASLDSSVRKTWSGAGPTPTTSTATEFYGVPFRPSSSLLTSTATSFYNVPWRSRPENPIEHTVTLACPPSPRSPITARKGVFSPTDVIKEVDEIDETYDNTLQQTAAVNIDRTALWLNAQTDYMKAVCAEDDGEDVVESFKDVEGAMPTTPDQASPSTIDFSPASKKSVRFADDASPTDPSTDPTKCPEKRISPIHDGTFWEGWRHIKRSQRARDVFQQRQIRVEAEHVRRVSCVKQHVDQLQGKYEITTTKRPSPNRPVSTFLPKSTEDDGVELIATVEKERQALCQLQSSAWYLAAQRKVNGGSLLTSPTIQSYNERDDVKILDLAGQVHCSWGWTVAADHPKAEVYTTVSTDAEAHVLGSSLEGPDNHFVVAAPRLWELPFEDNFFDVISARNLYVHLKTLWPKGKAADEWDLTLRECLRTLKPGGYFEFDLLDAELVNPDPSSQALGVEFAFSLKARGYDPSGGKSFLPRLKRAGFGDIKRAWMVLPVADVSPRWTDTGKVLSRAATMTSDNGKDSPGEINGCATKIYEPPMTGSTQDVRAMTGLVGARMWEQWMVKLNNETGRSEARCLEGVAKALEEAGRGTAAWRCLVGWARKDC
ncbi:Hypothetical protein R9X50_00039400 [Acrodontium crateriforme]|uniref:Methyltransferase type 11 domain-containing protein n=1 Tax=Acrodontium crateriforme TaxID=150365 RepID=A0AAQ3R724_9PEZI|nr:Hypothetical protein R9X50_00039400 [Acrodontium crateriforme]